MSQMQEYDHEVELIDYIEVILKRKGLILGFTVICGLVVGVSAFTDNRQYYAEALVVVSQSIVTRSTIDSEEVSTSEIIVPGLAAQTYEALAKGDELVSELLDALRLFDLSPDAVAFLQVLTVDDMATGMLEAEIVEATEKAESPLLSFRVKSGSDEIAVPMVNLWVQLFVQRHQGLSSNVADDFYRRVVEQHAVAKENYGVTERHLRTLQASHNRLTTLEHDTAVRSAGLREALSKQQDFDVSLDRKREELAFLGRKMEQTEWQGKWIGFVDAEELSRAVWRDGHLERTELIDLRRVLMAALVDSLQLGPQHDSERKQLNAQAARRILAFERDRQPQRLRARETQIIAALTSSREALAVLEVEVAGLELHSQVLQRNLAEEPPTLTVAKAIVDDELWRQVAGRGSVESRIQEKLGSYRLVSESRSPIFQDLSMRTRNAKMAVDSAQSRIKHLITEIPRLEENLAQTSESLVQISADEDVLLHELSRRAVELEERISREAPPTNQRLQRARITLGQAQITYFQAKQQQLTLRQDVSTLGALFSYEGRNVERLGRQIEDQTAEVDSLTLLRDRVISERDIHKNTFERFSRLLEQSRISREQAAGDIQVVSDAMIARPVPRGTVKKAAIAGIVGLMASTMLAFLLEYVARAREQKQIPTPTT